MKPLLKPIFELITGEYALFDDIVYNYVAMAVIGTIAFGLAFRAVGRLYDSGLIEGRGVGSLLHWFFRLIIFIVTFYAFAVIIWVARVLIALPPLALVGGIVGVIALAIVVEILRRRA